jgi:Fur family transcriptional regulator, peroxide stress response regulator
VERKHHLTPQREAVYQVVCKSDDHPTAADIIERLREEGTTMAYATVYNSLRYLTDNGLVHELNVGDSVTRYDARIEGHHHVVCRYCGKVEEVFTLIPDTFLQAVVDETAYTLDDTTFVVQGICPACLNKRRMS